MGVYHVRFKSFLRDSAFTNRGKFKLHMKGRHMETERPAREEGITQRSPGRELGIRNNETRLDLSAVFEQGARARAKKKPGRRRRDGSAEASSSLLKRRADRQDNLLRPPFPSCVRPLVRPSRLPKVWRPSGPAVQHPCPVEARWCAQNHSHLCDVMRIPLAFWDIRAFRALQACWARFPFGACSVLVLAIPFRAVPSLSRAPDTSQNGSMATDAIPCWARAELPGEGLRCKLLKNGNWNSSERSCLS